ncbi:hypothetical protein SLS62_003526 [Diatrype stigma]|uniref:U1-C C2H2-type zinc finger domain-containing protein n=1 Tax=Diatrype stigma TaxID=117547 RepID=A0AAN9YRB9_9PEZI
MSEYWKSTPKYWCKHCGIYVRDTKLERTNHEATGKHQGALKRFLRDLHRGHEQELREKDRAKREIERLNGVVGSSGSAGDNVAGPSSSAATPQIRKDGNAKKDVNPNTIAVVTKEQRQQQWEQLVELGIEVPSELRREMAMAGEWTVTNTRVVDDDDGGNNEAGSANEERGKNAAGIATGVRKRPKGEDDDAVAEEEAAIKGLFKKPRRWGRDTKQMAPEDDAELDALLSGTLAMAPPLPQPKKEEEGIEEGKIKPDPDDKEPEAALKGENEREVEGLPKIKKEESGEEGQGLQNIARKPDGAGVGDGERAPAVKAEGEGTAAAGANADAVPAVVFKKRKPKNIRQR